jgi:RNA polymerase-binding transcription factor DksA
MNTAPAIRHDTAFDDRMRSARIANSARAELTHIDHALARLDEGTYGLCEPCGIACRVCARDG